MNKKKLTEAEFEKALQSLDGIRRAEPAPFFFTRVTARLNRERQNIWEKTAAFISRPAIAIAGLALIVSMNAFILLKREDKPTASTQLQEDESVLAATTASYDYENFEP